MNPNIRIILGIIVGCILIFGRLFFLQQERLKPKKRPEPVKTEDISLEFLGIDDRKLKVGEERKVTVRLEGISCSMLRTEARGCVVRRVAPCELLVMAKYEGEATISAYAGGKHESIVLTATK